MYKAIQEIHNAFDRRGLKHKVDQKRDSWVLFTGMNGNESSYHFVFIKTDDKDNDVAMRSLPVANIPRSRRDEAYELLNSFQQRYRFIKFILDSDGDVIAQYDFPMAQPDLGNAAVEILLRATDILDKCYPSLKRLV